MIMIRRNREGIKKITVQWNIYIYKRSLETRGRMNEVKKEDDDERKGKESEEGSSS